MNSGKAVVLVGHGGVPRDCPRELVTRLKALEGQRRARGGAVSAEERDLEARIRHWPRTRENDPYRYGLEQLAARLRLRLEGARLTLAYNEFCAPSLEEAVGELVDAGITEVTVIPSMLTPGGVHSEVDIPNSLGPLRARFPRLTLHYAWPFELDTVAEMLSRHLRPFVTST